MTCGTTQTIEYVPSALDFRVTRATTNTLTFILVDDDGNAVDISLDTVKFSVRDGFGGTEKIPQKENLPGEHTDPENGETQFTIDKTEIDDETNRTTETYWFYEVRRVQPGGEENVFFQGNLIIIPDVGA